MQQKVQFIATVLHEPDLLILDEPFTGLDPINADVLRDIVKKERAAGRTILFSTHLMEHAEQLCDAVCIVARGERILDGALADVKASARGGRHPYRVELARRNGAPPAALPGAVPKGDGAWEVDVADAASAREMLRALVDAGEEIVRFERSVPTLHEIFVEAVQKHG
jgi:ABC-2 type transport system ATP-binding protein